MEIYGDLDFKEVGQLVAAALQPESAAVFPDVAADFAAGTIKQGRLAFFSNRVWIAAVITTVGSDEVATWIPLTNEISAFGHIQAVASSTWTITHNLQSGTPVVQIYDENNQMVIPDEVTPTDANTVVVTFNTAVVGRAIVMVGTHEGANRNDGTQNYSIEFSQPTASTTWVIGHGLGYYPIVRIFTNTNEEILPASIVHDSTMQVTVTFTVATSGYARLA